MRSGNNKACSNGEDYWKKYPHPDHLDDWGGWYGPCAPIPHWQSNGWGTGYVYGFRVPLLVVSAYTPAGYVDNSVMDFGSILKFVEVNFGAPGKPLGPIPPGTYADAYAENNLRNFFTLTSPRPFQTIHVNFNARLFFRTSAWGYSTRSRSVARVVGSRNFRTGRGYCCAPPGGIGEGGRFAGNGLGAAVTVFTIWPAINPSRSIPSYTRSTKPSRSSKT